MTDRKKSAGKYPTKRIKTSEFLPKVFQTETNKVWLDSTLDQMISKGNLDHYDGFFGSKSSKVASVNDDYIKLNQNTIAKQNAQLLPGIVIKDNKDNITDTLAFDDLSLNIATMFDEYNYNSAYASQGFVFNPPVNIDMLVNYGNYFWVQDLPTYVAVYTGVEEKNIIDIVKNEAVYTLQDDNNTFNLENGMIIKFEGNWGTEATDNTYIVAGVGTSIELILLRDDNGKYHFTNESKNNVVSDGYWDNNIVYNVVHNPNSVYSNQATSIDMINAYNTDTTTNKPVFFDGFNLLRHESNNDKLVNDVYVRLPDEDEIYHLTVTAGNVQASIVTDTSMLKDSYDTDNWDYEAIIKTDPEYIVVAREDTRKTAWSRINSWVSLNCLKTYRKIMPNFVIRDYATVDTKAKRSIIEFEAGMDLFNGADFNNNIQSQWLGVTDYYIAVNDDITVAEVGDNLQIDTSSVMSENLPANSVVVFNNTYTTHTYVADGNNLLVRSKPIVNGNTLFVEKVLQQELDEYKKTDVYFNDGWIIGQQKTTVNQEPLFKVFTKSFTPMEQLDPGFRGSKVFGYKQGNGHTDPILNKKLSYKDSLKGAAYEFENYLITEKYNQVISDTTNPKISFNQDVHGYAFFKQNNRLSTLYKTSNIAVGAKETIQYIVDDASNNFVIELGKDNFVPNYEYLVTKQFDKTVVVEASLQGVSIENKVDQYKDVLLAENNETLEFHNLISNTVLRFKDNGIDVEDTANYTGPLTVERTNLYTKLHVNNAVGTSLYNAGHGVSVHLDDVNNDIEFKINLVASKANLYHKIIINGQYVSSNKYTVTDNQIELPADLIEKNDIVDIEFINNDNSNSTNNTSSPILWNSNSFNELLDSFTIDETSQHWQSIFESIPNFTGEALGINNYSQLLRNHSYGGTILLHKDNAVLHDMQYANKQLSITGALYEQGVDYDVFVTRLRNQVRRLYSTKNYNKITDILRDALNIILVNKKGNTLYSTSNMMYPHKGTVETTNLNTGQISVKLEHTAHGDENIRDHVYVWLTEQGVRRILVKDKDYTIVGKTLTLTFTPTVGTDNQLPVIETQYHGMDEKSYIPPSMTKLGLKFGTQPQVVDGKLYTHDGNTYDVDSNELFDINSQNFDVVNAVQYEFECMVYAGLVNNDNLYSNVDTGAKYADITKFLPSQHLGTWYTLSQINNYIYTYYSKWASQRDLPTIIEEYAFDENDTQGWTWNYKDFTYDIMGSYVKHIQNETLPGHYVGIYNIIFGTSTPHLTPWNMLGFAFKPTWWDTHYNWTDPAKRTALLDALQNGIISEPNTPVTQDINYARYAWDWTNKCPVNTAGELVAPKDVLLTSTSEPQVNQINRPFVFGDWGPTEQQYRNTNEYFGVLIDAVTKLVPAKAFTEFFQPGTFKRSNRADKLLAKTTNKLVNQDSFVLPGNKNHKAIVGINILENFSYNTSFYNISQLYGSETNSISTLGVVFKDSTQDTSEIECITMNKRLYEIEDEAILNSTLLDSNITLEYVYDTVDYTANGISQAQYNYLIRNGYDLDQQEVYNNVDTHLVQKAGGFTSKNLVNFFAESSNIGSFKLSENDFNIVMYKSGPRELLNVSTVNIYREPEGYRISGLSSNSQNFKFYEPDTSINNAYQEIEVAGKTVKKYRKFSSQVSVAEYGTVFSKVQDVYNFIRGYFAYLENKGCEFNTAKDAKANLFVQWTVTSEETDTLEIEIGNTIKFTSTFGSVLEFNTEKYHNNDIVSMSRKTVEKSDLKINRSRNTVTISTKTNTALGNVTVMVRDFEHAFVFNDTTTFGGVLLDDKLNKQQMRLFSVGAVTAEWDGTISAPGYIVFDNHIKQNFDSSVQEVNNHYRTDITHFDKEITHARDITIGNIDREWVNELNLDPNVVTKFYQGAIKESGTNAGADRLSRYIKGPKQVNISEKYMFNHSYFGDTTRYSSAEIKIAQNEIHSNPQVIEFSQNKSVIDSINIVENDKRYVHKNQTRFNVTDFDNYSSTLNTAGELLSTETDYYVFDTQSIPTVWDNDSEYAKIESWLPTKSYPRGAIVRHNSILYKCVVDATGFTNVAQGINETGTKTNPTFPVGTTVEIDDEIINLQSTALSYNDIVARGSVQNPLVRNLDELTLDGSTLVFRGTQQAETVVAPATVIGNIINPYFATVAGKSITVNGTVIDFDNTPADNTELAVVVDNTPVDLPEVFTVVTGGQTDFTVSTTLSPTTYSVALVTVDGVPTTDYTVAGQVVTINSPTTVGGGEVVIVLTHQPVLETDYTIIQSLTPSGYFLNQIRVAGNVITDYVLNNQTVTFNDTSAFSAGELIEFVLVHVDNGMTTTQIISTINNAGVTGITASLSAQDTIQIEYTSASTSAELIIAPGATNTDLGFQSAGQVVPVVVGIDYLPLTMQEVVDQINDFVGFNDISASEENDSLTITKDSANSNLDITDGANTFGFQSVYQYSTTVTNTYTNMISAVDQINTHMANRGITDITASVENSRINIFSPRTSLDLGNTTFNDLAGLPVGVQANLESSISNSFDATDWVELNDKVDPVLFNIWVVNDSDYTVTEVDTVKTKFNEWNLFQVQNHGLYTSDPLDEDGCGICAGTATSDGNDAQVTTNSTHNLQVGDYVLLTNTTTQPAIDGIHRVTRLHPVDPKIFYIDRFINKCGNASSVMVLRSQRFENIDQMNQAESSNMFDIVESSISVTTLDEANTKSTNVFEKRAIAQTNPVEFNFAQIRKSKYRALNNNIENITIYDKNNNDTVGVFEVFDPLRGIIPGIAQSEIDMTSMVDLAAYNMSSDEDYETVEENYWSDDQIGKRWWNTSTVRYFDYDQGDYNYQSSHWGVQFPGSSIDVYEWTKSSVTPDEYDMAVQTRKTMFGQVATGEAYYVYDAQLQENIYYYSSVDEWDNIIGEYKTVYYFWVKNKDTIPSGKTLPNSSVASIIDNPTANGIAWCASLSPAGNIDTEVSNAFIVANASIYTNNSSSVMQINLTPNGINHNSWFSIAKHNDLIPDYYYIGLKNNLASCTTDEVNLPNYNIHEYSRYGDDRKLNQTWFVNHKQARENARVVINDLLQDINFYRDYKTSWNREFVKGNMPDKTWNWVAYVSENRNEFSQPTIEVSSMNELHNLDTSLHTTAKFEIVEEGLDRSEIWEYINNDWLLTQKEHSTIALNELVAQQRAGWDNFAWDSTTWDNTDMKDWWRIIVDACRYDWFTTVNKHKFNTLFFAMIDYVLSEQNQPNWVHKSTYVKVEVVNNIDTVARKYYRDTINSIVGYVNDVKPFHTKIDNIVDVYESSEDVNLTIEEDVKQTIHLDFNDLTSVFTGTTYDSGTWDTTYETTLDNGDNWQTSTDTNDNGTFVRGAMYASENDPNRQYILNLDFGTVVGITVQTNTSGSTVDNSTRTFVYVKNTESDIPVIVALEESKATTITTYTNDVITVNDASTFADNGVAYVNNEFITFVKNANDLEIISRSAMNTFNIQHEVGSVIVDVTDSFLTTAQVGTTMLNDMGESILTSTDSLAAAELQALGKGITL